MSGYPTRPSRTAYGPDPVNRAPIADPELQLDADIGKLMFWQLAGAGIVGARALAFISSAGSLTAHGEAWDPKRLTAGPTTTKPGTGHYRMVYAASYPDELGTSIATALLGATATAQGASALHCTCEVQADGITVDVYVWDAGGTAADGATLVQVF